jgi:hypothetical protein
MAWHGTAPHIQLWAITDIFSDGMGVFRIPNSDIVAIHFATYMKFVSFVKSI